MFSLLLLAASAVPPTEAEVLFARTVWPVLQDKCLPCHGGEGKKPRGGLLLTSRAGLLKGGDSGLPAFSSDSPEKSPLLRSLLRTDADFRPMPPKESDQLTPAQVEAFRRWAKAGAPWLSRDRLTAVLKALPKEQPDGVRVKTSAGLSPEWTNRTYAPADLWAYQPLRRPPVPSPSGDNPIDAFLGTTAAPLARPALARRLYFDVIGLPPSPEQLTAFLDDPRPDAYERLVARLLASPHRGEQLARHWLDVTRYADSSGLANDYERGSAWRYRDYVVRCFNEDRPYDRFVREQLAGDELAPDQPEGLIAVGFLRMGAWELTGMEVPRVARQRFLDDVTDTVGQVFLAHMLQCARCHDHKFDPVPTRDYYRFQAIFATTQLAERDAPFLPVENLTGFAEKKYLDARQTRLEQELRRITQAESEARKKWERANPDAKGQKPPRHEFLSAADLGLERIARKGLERLAWERDRYAPFALSVYTGHTPNLKAIYRPFRVPRNVLAGEQEQTHILAGGDPFSPKERVAPGTLSAAGGGLITAALSGRRRALAEWITHPRNPLTARVIANRVWQWHFCTPLAANPNNFGATGAKPTHPELLDWLACELIDSGWSLAHLQRLLLSSQAYRSARPRRLAAEELRDAMLAVSGELNSERGGIPCRPETNPAVALQPRQVMGTFAPAWEPSPLPSQRHRRTLYVLKLRGLLDPMQEAFNAPSPDLSCERRERSTTAPQALALLNSEQTRSRALAFAARLLRETTTRSAAIDRAFQLALGRLPTARQREACLKHWACMETRHLTLDLPRPKRPTEVQREAVEENTGQTFRFTEALVTAADFVPDLHPADACAKTRGLMEVCLVLFNTNEFLYLD